MPETQETTEFSSTLLDEKNIIQAFIEILKKEEDALIQRKMEDVDFLASDKARLVKRLTLLGEQRNQYLISQGLTPDNTGMNKWLAKQVINTEIRTIWGELLQLAKIAQQVNRTNGLIISTQLQHTQRAFSALQSAAGNISLYGPNGQAFI